MNIYQKIAEVMKDVEYLSKDDSIEYKTTKYKAISEEKVTTTVRNSLIKHGLVILPIKQEHIRDEMITTVNVTYRIIDIDNPEDSIEVVSSGTGYDTQDKGVGKAMTYSYKYMLLRTFAIPTGEDPDKISSAEIDGKKAITTEMIAALRSRFRNHGMDEEKVLVFYKIADLSKMSMQQHAHLNKYFNELKESCSV